MTSPPPPGWYPDPGGTAPFRWWDGQTWTAATSSGAAPASPVATTTPQATPLLPTQMQAAAAFPGALPQQAQTQPAQTQPPYGYQPMVAPRVGSTAQKTLWQANPQAMVAFIVTGMYVLIALTTPFGLIGIVPILASVRSFQAGEKLAPAACGAAVVAFIVGMLKFTHHF